MKDQEGLDTGTLIFLHIPKTAGSTFHSILSKQYKGENVYIYDQNLREDQSFAKIAKIPPDQKEGIKLVKGHMIFGVHKFFRQKARYITFLRHPIDRVISQYYYIKRNKHNPFHKILTVNNMDVSEFVSSGISKGMNNGQTRFVSGEWNTPFGECDQGMLNRAIENIRHHFLVVGITEKFDESILLMKRVLKWRKMPVYIKRNVRQPKRGEAQIDKKVIDTIARWNQLDLELYESAKADLEGRISAEENGFAKELDYFLNINRRHQKFSAPFAIFHEIVVRLLRI